MELLGELIFEIIFTLLIEGTINLINNKNISKWVRYPLLFMIFTFFAVIFGLIFWLGIICYEKNIVMSLVIWIVGILLVIGAIFGFRKKYIKKKKEVLIDEQ